MDASVPPSPARRKRSYKGSVLTSLRLQNFKKFGDQTFEVSPSPKIIVGRNGSGKTQLLWAIIFFLRAYNTRVATSTEASPFKYTKLKSLLGDPVFEHEDSEVFNSFIRKGGSPSEATVLEGVFVDGSKVTFEVKANSGLELQSTDHSSNAKIRFAFMQPMYLWGYKGKEEEYDNRPLLTSGVQHLRFRAMQLNDREVSLDFISRRLKDIGFHVTLTAKQGTLEILVVEEDGTSLEIGFCASSLQKIVAIYVMFCALAESNATQRIFLIDELEALLYDYVTQRLFNSLVSDCAEKEIQLIITTNSNAVISQVPIQDQMFLGPDGPIVPSVNYNRVLSELALIRDKKPALIVDGVNDVTFYTKYAGDLVKSFQLIPVGNRDGSWPHRQTLAEVIQAMLPSFKVFHLKDSEMLASSPHLEANEAYFTDILSTHNKGSRVVLTKLPCIESYLVLSQLLSSPPTHEITQALLGVLYKSATVHYFCKDYLKRHEVSKDYHELKARKEKFKMQPQEEEIHAHWDSQVQNVFGGAATTGIPWESYVKLVRGHSVVNIVFGTEDTVQIIGNLQELHPTVAQILDESMRALLKAETV